MGKPLLANNYQHCWMLNPFAHPVACCLLLGVVARLLQTGQTFRHPFAKSLKENLELMLVVTSSVILFDPLRGGHFKTDSW